MKVFNKIILLLSVVVSIYAAYKIFEGFFAHRICLNGYCARLWVIHEGFFPIVFLYALLVTVCLGVTKIVYNHIVDDLGES